MKNYELLYVTRPDLTDQDLGTLRSDVQNKITSLDGVVEKEDPWGKRQLAYEVKDMTEGIYTLVTMQLPSEGPVKLRDQLKIDERIIRYLITTKDRKRTS
ncbi:MAG: 30S ribosomal protein S6 [bacterium]|nr:30S ribosomal protein S6 [bacterium]